MKNIKSHYFFLLLSVNLGAMVNPVPAVIEERVPSLSALIHKKIAATVRQGEHDLTRPDLKVMTDNLFTRPNVARWVLGGDHQEYRQEMRSGLQRTIEENLWQNGYYHNLMDDEHPQQPVQAGHVAQEYALCEQNHDEDEGSAFCRAQPCNLIVQLIDNQDVFYNKKKNLFIAGKLFIYQRQSCFTFDIFHKDSNAQLVAIQSNQIVPHVCDYHFDEATGDLLLLKDFENEVILSRWSFSDEHQRYECMQEYALMIKDPQRSYNFENASRFQWLFCNNKLFIVAVSANRQQADNDLLSLLMYQQNEYGMYELQNTFYHQVQQSSLALIGIVPRQGNVGVILKKNQQEYYYFEYNFNESRMGCVLLAGLSSDFYQTRIVAEDAWPYFFVINHDGGTIEQITTKAGENGWVMEGYSARVCDELKQIIAQHYIDTDGDDLFSRGLKFDKHRNCFYAGGQAFRFDPEAKSFTYAPDLTSEEPYYVLNNALLVQASEEGVKIIDQRFKVSGLSTIQLALLSSIQKKVRWGAYAPLMLNSVYQRDYHMIEQYLMPHERVLCQFADDVETTTTFHGKREREDDVAEGERPAKR